MTNLWTRFTGWRNRGKGAEQPTVPVLLPLTPRYDPEKHSVYFDAIEAALNEREEPVHNIALTGSYGVGKSSILEQVARQYKSRVIPISLSSLGFAADEAGTAETRGAPSSTKTNRIQKEIVKQLLYSQDPVKMPGSRYRRVTRFRIWRGLGFAALPAVPIALVFYLAGWTASIAKLLPLPNELGLLIHLVVLAASTLLILAFQAIFHNRIQIDKITAGAGTISLSPKSATYFDEYLDEIVYFFEVVKRDIVVFEDIDRFDNAHIFETLRSLNTILNGAYQLKRRRIRFIYAIKDSIFDELGARAAKEEMQGGENADQTLGAAQDDAAEAEVARANRTKFFDLVVPVVPFITHRSARDLLVQTMSDLDHEVSDELVDVAARHVADMRLIKNIRNEFLIFKRQIIDLGSLKLDQNSLFAMMLYKSTHLSDFELIKLGKSNLDRLYRDGRALVAANIAALNTEVRRARMQRREARITANQCKELGDAFDAHIALTLRHIGPSGAPLQSRTFEGQNLDDTALRSREFWEKLATADGTVSVNFIRPNYGGLDSLNFTRGDIAEALGQPISSKEWAEAERERLDSEISEAIADREFLAHTDMSNLASRAKFTLEKDGHAMSFMDLTKMHLKSDLAVQLLTEGYIDRNFTLYTSTFYSDRVSANATNFILKSVDANEIDMVFELTSEDVVAIIRERGQSVLRERSAYNLSILNHLLQQNDVAAEVLIVELMKYGDEERDFLLSYVEEGTKKDELVRSLARRWSGMLTFLVSEAQLDDVTGARLMGTALSSLNGDVSYVIDDNLRDYLTTSYGNVEVFTSNSTPEGTASLVAEIIRKAGVKLPALAPLGTNVLSAVVAVGGYEVTRENLLVALGDPSHGLSLDSIADADETVYQRVLADLPGYLAVLTDSEATVADENAFVSTIKDVVVADNDHIATIIQRAGDCRILELSDVPVVAWGPLAEGHRFPATFANIGAYTDENGIDARLAAVLTAAGTIETEDNSGEPAKLELALTILLAADVLPSPELRAKLVGGLSLLNPIQPASLPNEQGPLVGYLIAEKVVADNAATFGAIKPGDIAGRAFAISRSSDFPTFMSANEVPPSEVGALVESSVVPPEVKDAVVDRFSELTAGTPKQGLASVGRYALGRGKALTFAETERLASEGVEPSIVIALLRPHLSASTLANLASVLIHLGGEYEKLAERNGKHPRLPNTVNDRALVDRLKELEVVSTDSETRDEIRVHMRQS